MGHIVHSLVRPSKLNLEPVGTADTLAMSAGRLRSEATGFDVMK